MPLAVADLVILEGDFAKMSMTEQLEMMHKSCMVVAAHGAGLTHVLFMPPGSKVLEVRTPAFKRHHFMACVSSHATNAIRGRS